MTRVILKVNTVQSFKHLNIEYIPTLEAVDISDQIVNMPSYKFTYFDVRGRGELCRYVFHAAGKDFEDSRIGGPQWQEFKAKTPFGQLPVLEVDGKPLAQSCAIARYLAKEFGLNGKTNWDAAVIDQFMDLTGDMFTELIKTFFEKDEAKKAELQKKLVDETYPKFLAMFEKGLESNGGKYFVGAGLTLADLAVYNAFDTPLAQVPDVLDKFPKVKAHREMVGKVPKLAEYISKRKHTDI